MLGSIEGGPVSEKVGVMTGFAVLVAVVEIVEIVVLLEGALVDPRVGRPQPPGALDGEVRRRGAEPEGLAAPAQSSG